MGNDSKEEKLVKSDSLQDTSLPEKGYRFVPITTGLFFLAVPVAIFWVWGANIFTTIIAGPLLYFGWSSLKIGIWGSQQLIDEMNLKGKEGLSEEARKEWREIHKLDD